jgi:hypothetical protein
MACRFVGSNPTLHAAAAGERPFADPDRVRGILVGAEYSGVDIARHNTSMRICGPGEIEQAARFAIESGPVARAVADAEPDARAAAELRRLEGSGGIELPGSVWLVSARP